MSSAEDAYCQQLQLNEILDSKFDKLEEILGEKLDSVVSLLAQFLSGNAPSIPAIPPVPSAPGHSASSSPIDTTPLNPDIGLCVFHLPRSCSSRCEFQERNQPVPSPHSPNQILVQLFTRRNSPSRNDGLYKPLTGIKLPVFRRRYNENVNAWITIIEDRFFL